MKSRQIFRKIIKWVFRGSLIGLPLTLTSTLALNERITWSGAVLLWFYTGQILRQRETGKDDQPKTDIQE